VGGGPPLLHPPDWARVRRAVFAVQHRYRYTYSGPVANLEQRLVMVPPDEHGGQRLLDYRCEVRGASTTPRLTWETDPYGNRVCWVYAARVPEAVDFEVTYRVERRAHGRRRGAGAAGGAGVGAPPFDRTGLLRPTALTAPDARLREVAAGIAATTNRPREMAARASDWASTAIAYQIGVTGVQTPAAMALHLGRGVCQDFAHLLVCVLRLLRIPARYVSGHLLGEGVPHAWVEALLPAPDAPGGAEVVAYDPTHHRPAGMSYITVAVGRDFADVTPTSGSFTGATPGALTSSKRAVATEVSYD
jgi:transglutaminase-like putative cysteine protease